jgi:hypothetical protein
MQSKNMTAELILYLTLGLFWTKNQISELDISNFIKIIS